ncbi:E3 ubiquitin-protein ligase [Acorus gramineus]|uniref:RING-type E3 ubiquitin transferase n=1 Tax=Acorus gramineus TaxID=55184 RepID=A0AAV9AH29_ACOGR|nr:E3 ubiquitin-protein ligase [Acorus gramineus]
MGAGCVKMSHAHGGDGGQHHNHHHRRRHNSNRSKPAAPPAWRSGNRISSSNQGDATKHLAKIDIENKLESIPEFPVSQNESKGSNSNLPLIDDDDDFCPTCLEGYDEENPKAFLQCTHHYHLPCIYEWMERSNNCPICDKTMIFA